jgi:hypothetical protein
MIPELERARARGGVLLTAATMILTLAWGLAAPPSLRLYVGAPLAGVCLVVVYLAYRRAIQPLLHATGYPLVYFTSTTLNGLSFAALLPLGAALLFLLPLLRSMPPNPVTPILAPSFFAVGPLLSLAFGISWFFRRSIGSFGIGPRYHVKVYDAKQLSHGEGAAIGWLYLVVATLHPAALFAIFRPF